MHDNGGHTYTRGRPRAEAEFAHSVQWELRGATESGVVGVDVDDGVSGDLGRDLGGVRRRVIVEGADVEDVERRFRTLDVDLQHEIGLDHDDEIENVIGVAENVVNEEYGAVADREQSLVQD